jgi:hypothetical protein
VAIVSYDEKPGIQAIATTAPDLPPKPGVYPTFSLACIIRLSNAASSERLPMARWPPWMIGREVPISGGRSVGFLLHHRGAQRKRRDGLGIFSQFEPVFRDRAK